MYILSLIATSVLITPLNQQLCMERDRPTINRKLLVLPFHSGYMGMHLVAGQFATYHNVLNCGKANRHGTNNNKIPTHSPELSRKLTGYLIFTLLLAGDVHTNPSPPVRDVDGDRCQLTTHAVNSPAVPNGAMSCIGCVPAAGGDHLVIEVNRLGEFSADPSTRKICSIESCPKRRGKFKRALLIFTMYPR